MSALAVLEAVPDDYLLEESPRAYLALDRESAPLLRAAGLELHAGPRTTQSDLCGRRPLREIATPEATFVLRSYTHGGLARHVTGERFADPDGRIRATFDVIHLSGWAPHESQQKPLRPGSAKARLADALGTVERPAGEKAGGSG